MTKSYSEILQDPSIDSSVRKAIEDIDPVMRNRFARVLEALEQKQRVEGLRKVQPWVGSYLQRLNQEFVETQKQLANPELRGERVSPEFLGGQLKGLLIAIDAIKQDLRLLEQLDIAEAGGLPDIGTKP